MSHVDCARLQASKITRDLCFVAQNSFETLRHRFSWCLWQSFATIFESDYTMNVWDHPRWEEMRMEFQSTIYGLISMRSGWLAGLQWCGCPSAHPNSIRKVYTLLFHHGVNSRWISTSSWVCGFQNNSLNLFWNLDRFSLK